MQLTNVFSADDLRGYQRLAGKVREEQSLPASDDLTERLNDGWSVIRQGAYKVRIARPKLLKDAIPDRVWSLLFRMGFTHLSGRGGATLECKTQGSVTTNDLDLVAIDNDVAMYIRIGISREPRRVARFEEYAAELDGLRRCFGNAIRARYGDRKIAAVYWSYNQNLTESDYDSAKENRLRVFNERELAYYESLVEQIGSAARFQFLADLFGSSKVNSLALKVPAVRVRLGDNQCYSFAIAPEKLLRIAYVSHRAKGKPTDVDTYQRLLKRGRIRDIRAYVNNGGYFPTNIVMNIRSRRALQFDKASTPSGVDVTAGEIGWLTLPAEYKSAWVIDGQHRLFAYADAPERSRAELTVLAFENLEESDQARLFIDINAKQKSVKQNLLVELFAELHWNSDNLSDRVTAIISKLVLTLDSSSSSPFYQKIVRADDSAASSRSISLKTFSNALDSGELFFSEAKGDVTPGAFWQADQFATLRRAEQFLDKWFTTTLVNVRSNWDLGKLPGGALGMNDSLVANILLLRSIVRQVAVYEPSALSSLTAKELWARFESWADIVATVYGEFQANDFALFRNLRGIQGQTQRYRELQLRVRAKLPSFNPEGLDDYAKSRDQNTINEARTLVDDIERTLQQYILGTLKAVHGESDKGWWFTGVPKQIRARILTQLNEEASADNKENRFNFIDYRAIVQDQWQLFKDSLGQDKGNASKEKRTAWMNRVNDIRNRVSHASKGASATLDDVQYLQSQLSWLRTQIANGATADEPGESDDDTE